jgi:hypothetical protein
LARGVVLTRDKDEWWGEELRLMQRHDSTTNGNHDAGREKRKQEGEGGTVKIW